MLGGKKVQAKLACISAKVDELQNTADEIVKNSYHTCDNPKCGKRTKIMNSVLVEKRRFVKSYSSYEDSCWEFDYYAVICEKCNQASSYDEDRGEEGSSEITAFEFIESNYPMFKKYIVCEGLNSEELWQKIRTL